MVIRHAEKPPDGQPGVMPDGSPNPEVLSPTGWERAKALVGLFDPPNGMPAGSPLATPMRLFASGSSSLRPAQTIMPLAAALGNLPIDTNYRKNRLVELVAATKGGEGPALVAWQHEDIPQIADLILGSAGGVPQRWPGDRFDLVWVFDSQEGDGWRFTQVPQNLLPGDSQSPIPLNA